MVSKIEGQLSNIENRKINKQDSFMSQHIYYAHHHSTNPNFNDNQSKLDEFFVNLAESQKPLENDFQQVLLDNLFDLYKSSDS